MDVPCTGDQSEIQEGRKSFPSGHSSSAFAGLGFLAFYLGGKLRAFTGTAYAWKFVVVVAPLLLALLIALSRISDYMHNWWDVLIGSLLGLVIAFICYRLFYPPMDGARCGVPQGERVARVLARETLESGDDSRLDGVKPPGSDLKDGGNNSPTLSNSDGSNSLPLTIVSNADPRSMQLQSVVSDKRY